MIRISLIIATHNRAQQLIEALESVVRQDLPPGEWECVVVNNNSADDTRERFAAFAAHCPELNLRMVFESKPGLSHARNRGLRETMASLAAIIDDDERINPGFLRAYASFFDTHPDAAVAGGRIIAEYPAGRPEWMSHYTERPIANPMDFGPEVRPFPAGRIPGGGNMAFRRSVVAKYGGFDPALGRVNGKLTGGEESDFFQRLQRGGETLWYVPDAVMWHIIPPQKLTLDYFRRLSRNVGASQRLRAQRDCRLPEALAAEIAKWAATMLLALGFLLCLSPRKALWLLRLRCGISRGLFGGGEREA